MDNKHILVRSFEAYFESGKNYIKQNNLPAAKEILKKALEIAIKLIEGSVGSEQGTYMSKAKTVAGWIEQINKKIEMATVTAQSAATPVGGATTAAPAAPQEPVEKPTVESALEELYALEGLAGVKAEVENLISRLKTDLMRKEQGLPVESDARHMVFAGNPGTGKTTVARIMGKIFCALGFLEKPEVIEVGRPDLVEEHIGGTAKRTREWIEKALGGVLFIDEAYTLSSGDGKDFGLEAINTLLPLMDNNRDRLVVIVAGYDELMSEFIASNPGLPSRFKKTIHFEDYDADSMYNIFSRMLKKGQYVATEEACEMLRKHFVNMYKNRGENFGNARDVRNFYEAVKEQQAKRISGMSVPITREILVTILPEDISAAIVAIEENKTK